MRRSAWMNCGRRWKHFAGMTKASAAAFARNPLLRGDEGLAAHAFFRRSRARSGHRDHDGRSEAADEHSPALRHRADYDGQEKAEGVTDAGTGRKKRRGQFSRRFSRGLKCGSTGGGSFPR